MKKTFGLVIANEAKQSRRFGRATAVEIAASGFRPPRNEAAGITATGTNWNARKKEIKGLLSCAMAKTL